MVEISWLKKYFDQCGQELDISAQFCSACGAIVAVEKTVPDSHISRTIRNILSLST